MKFECLFMLVCKYRLHIWVIPILTIEHWWNKQHEKLYIVEVEWLTFPYSCRIDFHLHFFAATVPNRSTSDQYGCT